MKFLSDLKQKVVKGLTGWNLMGIEFPGDHGHVHALVEMLPTAPRLDLR